MNLGLAGMKFVHLSSLYFTKLNFFMLVGTVESRQADLSMNLALTGAREKVVDYSAAYIGLCLCLCHCLCLEKSRVGVFVFVFVFEKNTKYRLLSLDTANFLYFFCFR